VLSFKSRLQLGVTQDGVFALGRCLKIWLDLQRVIKADDGLVVIPQHLQTFTKCPLECDFTLSQTVSVLLAMTFKMQKVDKAVVK
jgi:hypothetical protein